MGSSRIILLIFLLPCVLLAQPDRITAPIDGRRTVVLKGSVHPRAEPRFDVGPVEPAFRLGYVTLMLKKTDAQQAALEQLLQQQQDPASPNYHDWLTPEQYADRFGLSQHDLDKISAWLQSEGFTVEYTARGRNWLAFSGTAGQVRATFHTEIHRYRVDGEIHFAAAADPSIPAVLEPVVAGILGLDDFYPKAPRHPVPAYTLGPGAYTLAPGDIATIYDIAKLNLDGTGQTIAVVGQSDVVQSDIQAFRTKYNLPPLTTQNFKTVPYATDPGTNSALVEADIDLEWAGAIAPNAALVYVYGNSADGAAFYAIDQGLAFASVISESYGDCEATRTTYKTSYENMAQTANLFGMTWLAASGDSGAAACDYKASVATQGLAVNFPASIPEVTAVGASEFNEAGGTGTYWGTINGSTGGSAVSYIPEKAWNDTFPGGQIYATGGGASTLYPKPSWQAGLTPNDGARDVPDIALDGSNDHEPYNVYTSGAWQLFGGTSVSTPVFAGILALLNQRQSKPGLGNINSTLYHLAQSAPTAFHDITVGSNMVPCTQGTPNCGASLEFGYNAVVGYDQATGLGSVDAYNLVTQWSASAPVATTTTVMANPTTILTTAQTILTATVSAATGSATPTGSVTFTLASGGAVLGTATLSGSGAIATAAVRVNGTQLAVGTNSITASYGGASSFSASSGSVTVTITVPVVATTTTVTANPSSIMPGGSTALTATVTAASGSTTPTGAVSFTLSGKSLGVINLSVSGGTATAPLTVNASQLTAGNNTITASYGGSTGFIASSASVTVNLIVPTGPSNVIPSVEPNPVFQQAPDASGYNFFYTVRLSEIAGVGTTLTGFTVAGSDYSSDIPSFFGSGNIPANGTISVALKAQIGTAPVNRVFGFSGVDASGTTWSQQITVPFLAQPSSASMVLASLPATVALVPDTTHCTTQSPYYQQLNLQEQNGYEVQLTRFVAAGYDESGTIGSWFGSWRLTPFGSLVAGMCWSVPSPPETFSYEVDGTDTAGNKVTATLSVTFQVPASSPGALTVSKSTVSMSASPLQSAATTVNVSVPSGQAWTVAELPASQQSGWLSVSPLSGTGPATVNLVAAAPGLANGVYTTKLIFQSANTTPQFVSVPVAFTIGASTTTSIGGVANGASFAHVYAPGMVLSVFGANLANATQTAYTLPLPLTMAGVSATVNGVAAPLYFVSPLQLNIQVPYETATGTALLAVSNNGQVATYSFPVTASAPGIYLGPGSAITPNASGNPGQEYILFVTGAGEVSPQVGTGAAPGTQVPAPLLAVSMTIGGVAAALDYVGIPSWSVGTLQINFTVPQNAPVGVVPVVVTVGPAASVAANFTVQ